MVANRSDCWWCRYAAPELEDSFWKEIVRLGVNFLSTWTTGYMAYDDHQWALLPLLLASMLVFTLLAATMFMQFRYRVLVYVGMMLYFHQDAAKGTGMLSFTPFTSLLQEALWFLNRFHTAFRGMESMDRALS